jgi:hypothetical protein
MDLLVTPVRINFRLAKQSEQRSMPLAIKYVTGFGFSDCCTEFSSKIQPPSKGLWLNEAAGVKSSRVSVSVFIGNLTGFDAPNLIANIRNKPRQTHRHGGRKQARCIGDASEIKNLGQPEVPRGLKPSPKKRGLIAALKALRHPKANHLRRCRWIAARASKLWLPKDKKGRPSDALGRPFSCVPFRLA